MKINDGHYLELMDRLYNQAYMIETFICNHPLTKKKKKISKLADDACMLLTEAYQLVGEIEQKRNEKNNPIAEVIHRRHKKSKKRRMDCR